MTTLLSLEQLAEIESGIAQFRVALRELGDSTNLGAATEELLVLQQLLVDECRRLKLVVHEQELMGLGAVILVAEVERLRAIESIVRGMVSSDITVQHPGSNAVKRLVELLGVEK